MQQTYRVLIRSIKKTIQKIDLQFRNTSILRFIQEFAVGSSSAGASGHTNFQRSFFTSFTPVSIGTLTVKRIGSPQPYVCGHAIVIDAIMCFIVL